jgi:hypothetical protein
MAGATRAVLGAGGAEAYTSSSPNNATRLTILAIMAKTALSEGHLNIAPISKGRVLIVDDEPRILDSYSRSLANAGLEVAGVLKTAEALRRTETDRFHPNHGMASSSSRPPCDGGATSAQRTACQT